MSLLSAITRREARADSDGGRLTVATRPASLLPALGTKVRLDYEKVSLFDAGLTFVRTRENRSPHGRDHARVDPDRDCAFRLCCRCRTAEVRTPSPPASSPGPQTRCRKLTSRENAYRAYVLRHWKSLAMLLGPLYVNFPAAALMTSQPRTRTDPYSDLESWPPMLSPCSECSSDG